MQRSNVIDATALLRRAKPAANDQATHTPAGQAQATSEGPPTPATGSAAGQFWRNLLWLYEPLWSRMTYWPNVVDAARVVGFYALVGGLIGALTTCSHRA